MTPEERAARVVNLLARACLRIMQEHSPVEIPGNKAGDSTEKSLDSV